MDPTSQLPAAPAASLWRQLVLLAGALGGIALLTTITFVGPTTTTGLQAGWLAAFMASSLAAFLWWALYLWLLHRLAGLAPREALARSVPLMALLAVSLLPALAVFLAGKLPYHLVFDGYLRSVYVWIVGMLLCLTFLGQEMVLAGAIRRKGAGQLAWEGVRQVRSIKGLIGRLPAASLAQMRRHPLLVAILILGIVQRWYGKNDYDPHDMNDTLSVVYTILSWPPFRYYHDYSPQTYIFAHLPLFPILAAPFYWLFENVANLPKAWAMMLISAVADLGAAVLIYRQAGGRWKGALGLILAAAWLLSPVVAGSDDHPVGMAAAFTIAALASLERGWLCGAMLALGIASRTEAAFIALPVIAHFLMKRELRQKTLFLGAFMTTLGMVGMPFLLTDPGALLFAMFLQGKRQATGEIATLFWLMQPYLAAVPDFVHRQSAPFPATVSTLLATLLVLRDRRVARVAVVVALAYLLTIPVLHARYIVVFYAVGLYYAARYGDLLVAIATVAASWSGMVEMTAQWPGPLWPLAAQIVLAVALAVVSLLQPGDRGKAAARRPSGAQVEGG